MKNVICAVCVAAVVAALGSAAMAEITIDTVTVGNPGNVADTTGYGAVADPYNIGKYEVTAGQYCEFLNAAAKTDTHGLYNSSMDSSSYGCQITQNGTIGAYTYDFSGRPGGDESDWVDRPVNYVSFWDAARFANWLHNGQGAGDTETGAYTLTAGGISTNSVTRNAGAQWAVTSEDEWYKAAYHKNVGDTGNYYDYPTSSDTAPGRDMTEATNPGNNANIYGSPYPIDSPYYTTVAGEFESSDSPYGTFDQGGNVWEWNEAIINGSFRGLRGGSFGHNGDNLHASGRGSYYPTHEYGYIVFRVSEVPEPATMAVLMLGGIGILRRRKCVQR